MRTPLLMATLLFCDEGPHTMFARWGDATLARRTANVIVASTTFVSAAHVIRFTTTGWIATTFFLRRTFALFRTDGGGTFFWWSDDFAEQVLPDYSYGLILLLCYSILGRRALVGPLRAGDLTAAPRT